MNYRHSMIAMVVAGALAGGCDKKQTAEATPAPAQASLTAEAKAGAAKPGAAKPSNAKPPEAKPAAAPSAAEKPPTSAPTDKPVTDNADPLAAPADVAAAPADAAKTATGLASKIIKAGTGTDHPGKKDTVEVHYTGWQADGKRFDSSVERGTPAKFPLNRVIAGWTEGVQLMVVGEKRRFWIPANLAYGDKPTRPGAPFGPLVFDVELLSVEKAPNIEAPSDVAAAPADAEKSDSGLASKVLAKGTGTDHPKATDSVTVHYTGWQSSDGEMFDSSVLRKRPATFPLNGVIKGWTEGVQLMVVGEKRRFWIPANLAYGDKPTRPGAPSGQLVFDVELLKIDAGK